MAIVNNNWCRITGPSLTLVLLLILGLSTFSISAKAQFLAPPTPQNSDENIEKMVQAAENKQFPKEFQPPRIEMLTKELWEGKNVIRIKVISQAPIDDCKINFLKQRNIRTVDCVNEHGNTYKGLVDAEPPTQILDVTARDLYGDSSAVSFKLDVSAQSFYQHKIWNLLTGLFTPISNTFVKK
jgi:hypothetical protein